MAEVGESDPGQCGGRLDEKKRSSLGSRRRSGESGPGATTCESLMDLHIRF